MHFIRVIFVIVAPSRSTHKMNQITIYLIFCVSLVIFIFLFLVNWTEWSSASSRLEVTSRSVGARHYYIQYNVSPVMERSRLLRASPPYYHWRQAVASWVDVSQTVSISMETKSDLSLVDLATAGELLQADSPSSSIEYITRSVSASRSAQCSTILTPGHVCRSLKTLRNRVKGSNLTRLLKGYSKYYDWLYRWNTFFK